MGVTMPLPVQYWNLLNGVLKGDFGVSIKFHHPVIFMIASLPPWVHPTGEMY